MRPAARRFGLAAAAIALAAPLFPNRRQAIRSRLPMMVFMVGLTSLSRWILAQPIAK